jgi:acetyl-CoA decarbonylase/synthase complex subunit gamma
MVQIEDWREKGPNRRPAYVVGSLDTKVGPVPVVSSELTARDRRGAAKARWGIGRMSYTVAPGLYALGSPTPDSPVLVTANYKMSFDRLRSALPGRDAWILVLDTAGINVWCAAGKGSFGTDELVERIGATGLLAVVEHRRLVVPQLGAPGVAAHEVRRRSRFKVTYGPIRAEDLPAFIDAGFKATDDMRRKTFTAAERAVLIPMELLPALKVALPLAAAFLFLGGLGGPGGYWSGVLEHGLLGVAALLTAVLAGAVLVPLLLPLVPGRAFSAKGLVVGALLAVLLLLVMSGDLGLWPARLEAGAWLLLITALASYLALNFTGASTFTSLSGVERELRRALPLQIGAAAVGVGLWVTSRVIA